MSSGARILIVGVGGLGSPLALALAEASQVGALTLLDPDVVEISNLHRQILLSGAALGQPKVEAAAAMLKRRCQRGESGQPTLALHPLATRLSPDNSRALFSDHDLVIDGSDDLATKFLVNDTARALGRPALIGGIVRFSGQLQTIWPGAACYRCLFEEPPPPDRVLSCQSAGVLGPSCGLVAGLMATEALAILAGRPRYAGAVLTLDLLAGQRRRIRLSPRPDCPACRGSLDHPSARPGWPPPGKIDSAVGCS
jgi:adenylyltransferase/sulfurtransferase